MLWIKHINITMINIKSDPVPCADKECDNHFVRFRTTDKYCSYSCKKKNQKPPTNKKHYIIPKISKKQKKALTEYFKVRAEFLNSLTNYSCPVYPEKSVSDVHHMKGKEGYADDWARENNIPLLIDTRYFLAVSRMGHGYIELHPIWAKENGYSYDRL